MKAFQLRHTHPRLLAALLPLLGGPTTTSCNRATEAPADDAAGAGSNQQSPTLDSCRDGASQDAPPLASCNLGPAGASPLLDDFSDGDFLLSPQEKRNGAWFVFTDETAGCVEASVDEKQLTVTGEGFSSWGAGFGFSFNAREDLACLYDASAYSGVRFRARGNAPLRVVLPTKESSFQSLGGDCPDSEGCFDRHGRTLSLDANWRDYEINFCELSQEGWGVPFTEYNPANALGVSFLIRSTHAFEVSLDDVEFIPRTGSEDESCQAVCPLDQLPLGVDYDPQRTPQEGGVAGLSLLTFEQPTPSCGSLVRRYLTYIPSSVKSDPPVVLLLPGTGSDAESMHTFMTTGRFAELSERDGFVLVYANAAPGPYTLREFPNGGRFWLDKAESPEVDDRQYLEMIVEDLIERELISKKSLLFLAGHSIGGGLALEAARKAPERYRGLAAIMPYDGSAPAEPPAAGTFPLERMLLAYSHDDPDLPADYHELLAPLPAGYARALGLPDEALTALQLDDKHDEGSDYKGSNPIALRTRNSRVTRIDYSSEDSSRALRVLTFDRAGHFWPVSSPFEDDALINEYGFRNRDIDMSEEIWSFFKSSL